MIAAMRAVVRRALLWAGRIVVGGALASACTLTVSLDELSEGPADATGGAGGSSVNTGGLGAGGSASSSGGPGSGGSAAGGVAAGGAGGRGPDGLVGYWPLDEGTGTIAGDAVGTHDGFLIGGAAWTEGWSGGAVAFAGGLERIEMPTLFGAAFPASGTLSLWFRPTFEMIDTASRGIFDNYDTGRSHLFVRRANGETEMVIQVVMQPAGGDPYVFGVELAVVNGEWNHLVVVWDTDNDFGRATMGGNVQLKPIDDPNWLPAEQELILGGSFIGVIDEVRLFDRPLSEDEVAAL
jgi:hypothetical protein